MRKVLSGLVLLSLVVVPMLALAQQPIECCVLKRAVTIDTTTYAAGSSVGASGGYCPLDSSLDNATEKWGLVCLLNTINTVVDWIFVILIALTVVFVILGAMDILMAAGSPEKVTAGRNKIMYAAVGLIVAFVAKAVPSLVKAVLGY